jgi:hypothetical protein
LRHSAKLLIPVVGAGASGVVQVKLGNCPLMDGSTTTMISISISSPARAEQILHHQAAAGGGAAASISRRFAVSVDDAGLHYTGWQHSRSASVSYHFPRRSTCVRDRVVLAQDGCRGDPNQSRKGSQSVLRRLPPIDTSDNEWRCWGLREQQYRVPLRLVAVAIGMG